MNKLTYSLIQKAHRNHLKWFPTTPIEYCETLSHTLRVPFFFKCDFLQPMGSNCIRGAYFMLSSLDDESRSQTIAIAVNEVEALSFAYVAELLNLAMVLYMREPEDPDLKEKIQEHKVEVKTYPKGLNVTKLALEDAETMGYLHLNITNSPMIEAANGGSLAIETFDQIPQLRNVLLPLSELSLSKGFIHFIKQKHPDCLIYGCCDKNIERRLPSLDIDDVITVSEKQKEAACLWLLKQHQLVVTPEAASVIAACFSRKMPDLEGVTGTILTERSIPFEKLQRLVS
ncbi:MAG: L-threonine ammonia-lyase [Chlamydiia bacterium]|nr:L-threonine ammonia-lyase [Chlamydiia bacterium]